MAHNDIDHAGLVFEVEERDAAGAGGALPVGDRAADEHAGAGVDGPDGGRRQDAAWPFRVADDYLRAAGLVLMGWAWARRARACESRTDDPWHADQLAAARFGIEWLLPEAAWLLRRVQDSALALPWAPGA